MAHMIKAKNYEELPMTIGADEVAAVLGISRSSAYELLHSEGFPILRLGRRLLVPRDRFIQWINKNTP